MTSLSFSSIKGTHYSRDWVQDNFRSLWNEANSSAASPVAYDFRHHYAIVNINSWADDGFRARVWWTPMLALSFSLRVIQFSRCNFRFVTDILHKPLPFKF